MPSGNPALSEFVRDTIRRAGPQPFRWFMEQALYHPAHGFYSSGRAAIGRHGDYFTNASVGPLFGKLVAAQFREMWETCGRPAEFTIVEQGAHHGEFARDVLTALQERAPEFFGGVHYEIIEPFAILQARQEATLNSLGDKVSWQKSLEDLPVFCGIHFSNELLDAMPVHLVTLTNDGWKEKYLDAAGEKFELIDGPLSIGQLQSALRKLPASLCAPYDTEINLAAPDWIERLGQKLQRGYVLTVDYGYPRAQFFAPERTRGTLLCYSRHRVLASPLEQIGDADITAHVEWTGVVERAEAAGLRFARFADQHHFFAALISGLPNEFENLSQSERRALQTLLHPEMLGTTFQFLALAKNVPTNVPLSGFGFATNGRVSLGI